MAVVSSSAMAQDSIVEKVVADCGSTQACSSESVSVARRLVEIPREEGLQNVEALLMNDMCNRYQAKKPELNFILQCERALAKFVGMKYACALNSGGTAISLGLEAMKRVLFPEDRLSDIRVYSNAFTFHAVPSACVVAGFGETLKLIEATEKLVVDLDHLERCIQEDLASGRFAKGKMILVLSYMRGRVPDMNRVMAMCQQYDMQLLEDSAHGYGCSFEGRMCGSFGVVSTISTQSNKLLNAGEGGMVFTNDPNMQAFFIFSAGSYEELWRKHEEMAPPEEVCLKFKCTVANKSVRMTNIQAALMLPQIQVMQGRIDQHNAMYKYLVECTGAKLDELCGMGSRRRLEFIEQAHELVGPVFDSLQVRVMGPDGRASAEELPGLQAFLKQMQDRKHSIAKFADPANARNFKSWQYLRSEDIAVDALPLTVRALANVCDLRLLCHDTEPDMEKLATDLAECFRASFVE